MYKKPTEEQINYAIEEGWSRERAERGYDIFDFDRTGLLEINRIDAVYVGWGENGSTEVDDNDCAVEAERSGFCKIIPVDELPENFDRRYFGWVDTPANRLAIRMYCERYCS